MKPLTNEQRDIMLIRLDRSRARGQGTKLTPEEVDAITDMVWHNIAAARQRAMSIPVTGNPPLPPEPPPQPSADRRTNRE